MSVSAQIGAGDKDTDRIVRENFLFWSNQVAALGQRLIADNSVLDAVKKGDLHSFNASLVRSAAENYYFCVSLGKLLRWLDHIQERQLAPKYDFTLINSRQNDWKDVRDMLEHDDEYLLGGGKHPRRYEEYAIGPISVTAHATTRTKGAVFRTKPDGTKVEMHDQYSIGGRVDVGEVLDCVVAVVEALESKPPKSSKAE